MTRVTLDNVSKTYGSTSVLQGVNLQIDSGEFVVLVGPSGCGKTTLLRMMCGLEEISGGELRIGDEVVNHLPPAKRGIAMVFQSYALYPHMNVFDNMAFGLKLHGADKAERQRRIEKAARSLHIDHLLERKPRELSGGQRQRVAIGRAIVREPRLFLFDEPLSNLDASLRVKTRVELARLHRDLGATMVYVTHDQVEAMTLGDKIVVMHEGCVQQAGAPLDLYQQPANRFVASFIGSPQINLLPAKITATSPVVQLELPFGQPATATVEATTKLLEGQAVEIGVRPEHLRLTGVEAPPPFANGLRLDADVTLVEQLGEAHLVHLRAHDHHELVVRGNAHTRLRAGDRVVAWAPAEALHVFITDGRACRRLFPEGAAPAAH
ncbi:MAG TPA: sn-glycerol-3-phosphate ABC transporter ATP-binding protein UgpC [Ideonella sp.]|uniref:ABC transporter ATP-binding protein n=1 Tax=Ideonella sp. TaxID=1929293 RepID=UPI002E3165EB|nr:sn-glycerol-3-phosphate ABC transporter ATP-binding protein UgpC [Ideonella sp.]HEX5688075.1 sn-glycerol-3-phosphate ABC transporter ATP-binding protein UgpC [Ideonella sp.]